MWVYDKPIECNYNMWYDEMHELFVFKLWFETISVFTILQLSAAQCIILLG